MRGMGSHGLVSWACYLSDWQQASGRMRLVASRVEVGVPRHLYAQACPVHCRLVAVCGRIGAIVLHGLKAYAPHVRAAMAAEMPYGKQVTDESVQATRLLLSAAIFGFRSHLVCGDVFCIFSVRRVIVGFS